MTKNTLRKLQVLLFLFSIVLIVMFLDNKQQTFVKNQNDDSIITFQDITITDSIILEPNERVNISDSIIKDINPKFNLVNKDDTLFCDNTIDGTVLMTTSSTAIINVEGEGGNYSYYREDKGKCNLIGEITKVRVHPDNFNEAYANESIYTFFTSDSDLSINGLVRILGTRVKPFNTNSTRYVNPSSFVAGVFLIENRREIVAFNELDVEMFRQVNDSATRIVHAVNSDDRTIFSLVEDEEKVYLEGYDLNKLDDFKKGVPVVSLDITDYMNLFDSEVSIKKNEKYLTFANENGVLVVSKDFGEVFFFKDARRVVAIEANNLYLRMDNQYIVVNLKTKKQESLGHILADRVIAKYGKVIFVLNETTENPIFISYPVK